MSNVAKDAHEAVALIASEPDGGPEAAGLLVELMTQNKEDLANVEARLREGVEADRDRWKEEALDLRAQLHRIEGRLLAILDPEPRPGDMDGGLA